MYGKIINNSLVLMPKKITYGNVNIWNPPDNICEELGYYPIIFTDMPDDILDDYHYEPVWIQEEYSIRQSWQVVENDYNVDNEYLEAGKILMGVIE